EYQVIFNYISKILFVNPTPMSTDLTINSLLPFSTSQNISQINTKVSNTTFVGIDFGTSTTVVSIAILDESNNLNVHAIELNQKMADGAVFSSYKIPSVIAW